MLINARQSEETRIAIVENNQLMDLDIENVDREQKKSNIYKARISRIEPSLNAVFVNYGEDKNGFLPYKEIAPECFKKAPEDQNTPLNELLDVGQELIVQIAKEERGSKGAALTTFITLAGCYMVLMPNNPSAGGISRRIEGDERRKLKALFDSLTIPKDMGVIIRTAGVDRSADEIQADLDTLVNLWDAIKRVSYQRKAPFLIHKESDITIRAIRDHLKEDVEEIIIDEQNAYEDLKRQLSMLRPHFVERLQLYKKEMPLFNAHQIEKQIESAFKREVTLPSGGSIVIDTTEALTAIDINSARATKGDNIEETALATNLEAAEEIARQLRLRDLGGLIVVDFIDMSFFPNQKTVEQKLVDMLMSDRARIQMTRISKFGLVEISRQRLQASLGESVMHACPRCQGHGFIRSVPSISLSILRNVRAEALRDKTNEIRVQLPVDVATFLLNEKREEIYQIESSLNVKVLLIPNANLQSPHYNIQRIWGDVYNANRPSFDLVEKEKDVALHKTPKQDKSKQPALKSAQAKTNVQRTEQVQKPAEKIAQQSTPKKGFWAKLRDFFFKEETSSEPKAPAQQEKASGTHTKPQQKTQQRQGNSQQRQQKPARADNNQYRDRKSDNRQSQGGRQGQQRVDHRNNGNEGKNNNRSRQSSNRMQVHQSEEVVDIASMKKESPLAIKAAKERAMMKTISTTPEEKISIMVKEVLAETTALSDTVSQQVETQVSNTRKTKYLNFEVVTLDFTKADNEKPKKKAVEATKKSMAEEAAAGKEESVIENQDTQPEATVDIIVGETTPQQPAKPKTDEQPQKKAQSRAQTKKAKAGEGEIDSADASQNKKPRTKKANKKPAFVVYSPAIGASDQGFVPQDYAKSEE